MYVCKLWKKQIFVANFCRVLMYIYDLQGDDALASRIVIIITKVSVPFWLPTLAHFKIGWKVEFPGNFSHRFQIEAS
jgi:hypothetical protein